LPGFVTYDVKELCMAKLSVQVSKRKIPLNPQRFTYFNNFKFKTEFKLGITIVGTDVKVPC